MQKSEAKQGKWDYLIHRVSPIFPKRQYVDEGRCCSLWMECWSTHAGCYVFTPSHSFVVQLITCKMLLSQLFRKFPCWVYWLSSKQPPTPAQPCLSCSSTAPNPPSTAAPLHRERDPTQNWEEAVRRGLLLHCLHVSVNLFQGKPLLNYF